MPFLRDYFIDNPFKGKQQEYLYIYMKLETGPIEAHTLTSV